MRIGEVATLAGVNVETLRYYERRGLLAAPRRSPSGHRAYDEDAVRFVRAIKEAQGLGFTLAEIEEYLRLARRPGGRAPEAIRVRLAAKIDQVDEKIASLRRVREELARVLGCACASLDRCTCGAAYLARRGRDPELDSGAVLHVTNGDSAGNTLRRTALGGAVLPWQDVLNEGPLPPLPPGEFRQARARFLSACGWGGPRPILDELERRDRLLGQAVAERRQVVLWFEHDLYDQLQLLQILAMVDPAGHQPGRVELVNVGAFEGRPDFGGLGELTADELESLWDVRRPVTDELVELGRLGWDAVRAPRPTAVEAFLARDTAALPFLAAALRRLLEQLPDTDAGLSRSERQPLESLAAGPRTVVELFVQSQRREEAPFDGDAWFFRRLAELGAGAHPLLALAGGGRVEDPPPLGDPRSFARATLELTDAGRAVLAGAADRVALLGIDRWVGGTHLRPGHLWRWDRAAGRVVAAPGMP